jgi:hypothetical protein
MAIDLIPATTDETTLSAADKRTLEGYERIVEKGMKAFVEMGEALRAIRDGRLYRAEHATFEEYLKGRWGLARATAYQLIGASEVVENVRNCGHDTLPANESQARPLTKLPPEEQADAWQEAVEVSEGKPTARHVEEAVQRRLEPPRVLHVAQDTLPADKAHAAMAVENVRNCALPAFLRRHSINKLLPAMTTTEYDQLVMSIESIGIRLPITLFEQQILDGWHRYKACLDAEVEPRFQVFDGSYEDAMAHSTAMNFCKSHLTPEQLEAAVARLDALKAERARERMSEARKLAHEGVETLPHLDIGKARDKAGEAVGVSGKTIDKA